MRTPAQDEPVRYLTFAPGLVVIDHASTLLVAEPKTVLIRSAERRGGKVGSETCSSRWSEEH